MKKLLLITITALIFIACENTTEPKDVNVSVNEITNQPIQCKRIWLNTSSYSYSLTSANQATVVDEIKLSKGFGLFMIELRTDTTWAMRTATEVKYIKL